MPRYLADSHDGDSQIYDAQDDSDAGFIAELNGWLYIGELMFTKPIDDVEMIMIRNYVTLIKDVDIHLSSNTVLH